MKLLVAGGEFIAESMKWELLKFPYLLFSFYTLRGKKKILDYVSILRRARLGILDSGAYSLLYGAGKNHHIDLNEYLSDYISIIRASGIEHFVELDLDGKYDIETINATRREIEKHVGKKAIPCWHYQRGEEELLRLSRDYDYIALGGLTKGKREEILSFASKTIRSGGRIPKIHLMGVHEPKYFNDIFYSCDCSQPVNGMAQRMGCRFAAGTFRYAKCYGLYWKKALKYSMEAELAAVRYYDDLKYKGEEK